MQERRTLKRGEDIGRDERTGRQKGWGGERERRRMRGERAGEDMASQETIEEKQWRLVLKSPGEGRRRTRKFDYLRRNHGGKIEQAENKLLK